MAGSINEERNGQYDHTQLPLGNPNNPKENAPVITLITLMTFRL